MEKHNKRIRMHRSFVSGTMDFRDLPAGRIWIYLNLQKGITDFNESIICTLS